MEMLTQGEIRNVGGNGAMGTRDGVLEELRESCNAGIDNNNLYDELLVSNVLYNEAVKGCIGSFNALRSILTPNQLDYLLSFEETLALKEDVVKNIVVHYINDKK